MQHACSESSQVHHVSRRAMLKGALALSALSALPLPSVARARVEVDKLRPEDKAGQPSGLIGNRKHLDDRLD
jgi:hypothetical protein